MKHLFSRTKFFNQCLVVVFCISISACIKPDETISKNSDGRIETRGSIPVFPNSYFEYHNDYILWLYDNYLDSINTYASDPVDFMAFSARKLAIYNSKPTDLSNALEGNHLAIEHPYYVKNVGFTNESNVFSDAAGWSNSEINFLYTVLDSIYIMIETGHSETATQNVITRGKSRLGAHNFDMENSIINCLTQASYSLTLMFELDDLYGDGPSNGWTISPCALISVYCDVEQITHMHNFDPEDQHMMDVVASVSAAGFAHCTCDCM